MFRLNFKPSSASLRNISSKLKAQHNSNSTSPVNQRVGIQESDFAFHSVILFVSVNKLIILVCTEITSRLC